MKPATEMIDLAPPATQAVARSRAADHAPSRLVDLYALTKPRMNFLVVITTMIGYLLVTKRGGSTDWLLLFHTLMGTTLCAASAAVLNQVIERDIDAKMPRTRNRPIPAGRIS